MLIAKRSIYDGLREVLGDNVCIVMVSGAAAYYY